MFRAVFSQECKFRARERELQRSGKAKNDCKCVVAPVILAFEGVFSRIQIFFFQDYAMCAVRSQKIAARKETNFVSVPYPGNLAAGSWL